MDYFWLKAQPKAFCSGEVKLAQRCEKCTETESQYVEKWHIVDISNVIILYNIFNLMLLSDTPFNVDHIFLEGGGGKIQLMLLGKTGSQYPI